MDSKEGISRSAFARRIGRAALAVVLAGCGHRDGEPRAPNGPTPSVTLEGQVSVEGAAPLRGHLVLAWVTPEEAAAAGMPETGPSFRVFRNIIERSVPVGPVDFGAVPHSPYRIAAPPGSRPYAVLDVDHSFFATAFGEGRGGRGLGAPGGGDIVLTPQREPPAVERCVGERTRLVRIDAPEVVGRVGNPSERRFCAWLPPSHANAPRRRYPLVLVFGGFMSTHSTRIPRDGASFDRAMAAAGREALVVGVDTSTRTGSSYLVDSEMTGAFDTFLSTRGLAALERELPLLRRRTARALVGQSTGGLNALSFGLRHSDLFAGIGASAPDAPDLESWLFVQGTREIKPFLRAWLRLEDALGGPGQFVSYASDWSPDPSLPKGFAWPFDPSTGRVTPVVLQRWIDQSPAAYVEQPSVAARVQRDLGGRIVLAVGARDEFELDVPTRRFSQELNRLGIDHRLDITPTGHDGGTERIETALRTLLPRLDPAEDERP